MEPYFIYHEEINKKSQELDDLLKMNYKPRYENKNAILLKKLIYASIYTFVKHKKIRHTQINILKKPEVKKLLRSQFSQKDTSYQNIAVTSKPIITKRSIEEVAPNMPRKNMSNLMSMKPLPTKTGGEVLSKIPPRPLPIPIPIPIQKSQTVDEKKIEWGEFKQETIPQPSQRPQPRPLQPSVTYKSPISKPTPNIAVQEYKPTPQIPQRIPQPIYKQFEEPINQVSQQPTKLKEVDLQDIYSPLPEHEDTINFLEPNIVRSPDELITYNAKELNLDTKTFRVFSNLQNRLFSILEKSPGLLDDVDFFNKNLKESIKILNLNIDTIDVENLKKYLKNYMMGFHKLQPLVSDPNINAVYCYGANQPILVQHIKYGKIQTNLSFNSNTELDDFIKYMAKKAGKPISMSNPSLQFQFPNGFRFDAVLGGDFVSSKFNLIKP